MTVNMDTNRFAPIAKGPNMCKFSYIDSQLTEDALVPSSHLFRISHCVLSDLEKKKPDKIKVIFAHSYMPRLPRDVTLTKFLTKLS